MHSDGVEILAPLQQWMNSLRPSHISYPFPLQSGTGLNTEIDCSLYSQDGLQQHAFISAHE